MKSWSMLLSMGLLLAPALASAQERVIVLPAAPSSAVTTLLRIRPPRGAVVSVYDVGTLVARVDAPSSVVLRSGPAYRVVATAGPDVLWSGDIAANGGTVDVIWGDAPAAAPAPAPLAAPVVRPAPVGDAMSPAAFAALLAAVDAEFFDRDKAAVVRAAAAHHRFSTAQAGAVLARFDFESERMAALVAMRDRLVNRENGYLLAQHFFFTSDRRKVVAMFSG